MPLLSIVTASFNASATIRDCFDSVCNQSVRVEHILVDGKSEDATLDIAEQYDAHLARVISEPDEGMYDAMNKGVRLARGEIIGILNADDFYPSDTTLATVIKAFDNSDVEACYGDLLYVDGANTDNIVRYWRSGPYDPNKFYRGWMPPHPTFFVRRRVYERYGLFNPALGSAADYELMLRFLVKHNVTTAYIPEVLVKMRTGGMSNASLKNRLLANRMDRKAWEVNGLRPYPWTLWMKPLRKINQWMSRPTS